MSKPTAKQVRSGDVSLDIEDAKVPFKYIGTRQHVWGSYSKGLDPLSHCVQENIILSMPGVIDCKVHKTIAYVIFKNNPHLAKRYNLSGDGQAVARINDDARRGRKELLKYFRKPVELWLEVPRKAHSLERLRSPEMRQIRKESRERRRGQEPGSYDNPSKRGYRNGSGQGLAHMWPAK